MIVKPANKYLQLFCYHLIFIIILISQTPLTTGFASSDIQQQMSPEKQETLPNLQQQVDDFHESLIEDHDVLTKLLNDKLGMNQSLNTIMSNIVKNYIVNSLSSQNNQSFFYTKDQRQIEGLIKYAIENYRESELQSDGMIVLYTELPENKLNLYVNPDYINQKALGFYNSLMGGVPTNRYAICISVKNVTKIDDFSNAVFITGFPANPNGGNQVLCK